MERYYYLNDPEPTWKKALIIVGGVIAVLGCCSTAYMGFQLWSEVQQTKQYASDGIPEPAQVQTKADVPPKEDPEPEPSKEESGIVWEDRPRSNEKIGTLIIPKIDAKITVWEGTGDQQLSRGVGHHESSVLPGEGDNSVLAGHRETAFIRAEELEPGDRFIIKTEVGTFTYRLRDTWITDDQDPNVISSIDKPVLRAYTCWPLNALYSGYAPKRYVMEATLVDVEE